MSEFRTIDIDLDVHKLIENERTSFSESANEALRRLLKLPSNPSSKPRRTATNLRAWSGEGVVLPHGTAVRMRYNGRLYEGEIVDGKWIVEGQTFDSPSGAASGIAVTKRGKRTRLDGWGYWEVKRPTEGTWLHVAMLRTNTRTNTMTAEDLGI